MSDSVVSLPTVGTIAARLGQPIWRVEYLLRSRRLSPVGRAGHCRVFSDNDVAYLARELQQIDAKRNISAV